MLIYILYTTWYVRDWNRYLKSKYTFLLYFLSVLIRDISTRLGYQLVSETYECKTSNFLAKSNLNLGSEIARPTYLFPLSNLFFCFRCIQQLARLADSRVNLSIFHRICLGRRKENITAPPDIPIFPSGSRLI